MPPRLRNACGRGCHKENVNSNDKSNENAKNKENICLSLRKRNEKGEKDKPKLKTKEDSDLEFERMLLSFQKQEFNSKPLTFWEKKLRDLECQTKKKKKCQLYEFSGTDDSDSLYKTEKKKPTQKCGIQKKKLQPKSRINKPFKKATNSKIKAKEKQSQSLLKEQAMLSNEREKVVDEKISPLMPFPRMTSTPSVNKVNLVGASSFIFLSPVLREVDKCYNMKDGEGTLDDKMDLQSKTLKRENKLHVVNTRVLRSRVVTN